jgi:proteasome lid subunit RPN8/RPN11
VASQQAIQQIVAHGNSDLGSELGGALLGSAYRHEGRVYVEVSAALPAESSDHGPVHFKFTADSWLTNYPDLDIVGWFHTHPNLGVFYSGDDVVVHSAAFTLPWHVGLVLDPVRNEASFFGWVNGVLAANSGFYERHDNQEESAVPWKIVPSAVWEAGSDETVPSGSAVYAPVSGWPSLPSFAVRMSLLAGAVGLILGFFFLAGWIFTLDRQMNRLESVALILADEALTESNAAACPDSQLRILTPLAASRERVGTSVIVVGTADFPNATRYRVEVRSASDVEWTLVDARRRDTTLGELAVWDTVEHKPGSYEIRLTAVDRNNIILSSSPQCIIDFELVPQT